MNKFYYEFETDAESSLIKIKNLPDNVKILSAPRDKKEEKYYSYTLAEMYNVTFSEDCDCGEEIVMLKDIEAFSFCEHHMALMYNMKISVGYIPNQKVIGLSKIVRICDMVCRRLQIQERIGKDIIYILKKIVNTEDIAIKITAEHSCITTRGIKRNNTVTTTMIFSGKFKTDDKYRNEFLQSVV